MMDQEKTRDKKGIILTPIGFVKADEDEAKIRATKSSIISTIEVAEELSDALEGLEEFSHLLIIFLMHKVDIVNLKSHPRGRLDLPLTGIFATRSTYRPNHIGLTLVQLLERKDNHLKVKGLDAIDGTPVLDIKPYDPIDRALEIRLPSWWWKLNHIDETLSSYGFKNSSFHFLHT